MSPQRPILTDRKLVLTQPAGTVASLARRIRTYGGTPVLLPGLSLRAMEDRDHAQTALRAAMGDELLLFTSPAAVRFAAALITLQTQALVLAVGQGTARVLARYGLSALAPVRCQNSEGLLALSALQSVCGRHVALIGAAHGRVLLPETLLERGAKLREVHVYRRLPARLDVRHVGAVQSLPTDACVLLSSAQALRNLHRALSPALWRKLCALLVIVSSQRLVSIAMDAGFERVRCAASAGAVDLLDAACHDVTSAP